MVQAKLKMIPVKKIYHAFYRSGKKMLYFNELKRITGLSDSSLSNALSSLLDSREIGRKKEISNTFYYLRDRNRASIHFSEFDVIRFEGLSRDVIHAVGSFLEDAPREVEFVILFGSASRGEETPESDIDILVVMHRFDDARLQKVYEAKIRPGFSLAARKAGAKSLYPFSVAFVDIGMFTWSFDHLVRQARETGFPILGAMNYHRVVFDEKYR